MLLTDDAQMSQLNVDYRAKKGTTDVLSFPLADELNPHLLGDVVISVEQAERQAEDSLEAELVRLLVHGICHLQGYVHKKAAERREMRAAEAELLAPFSLVPLL